MSRSWEFVAAVYASAFTGRRIARGELGRVSKSVVVGVEILGRVGDR